jgi:uracil-DNA glycosylase
LTIEEYFGDWLNVIDIPTLNRTISTINNLYHTQSVMPEYKNIFRAFHLCPYNDLRIIFLGQDPYPQKGVATGVLFGNKENTKELSPSLEVIKEACIDYTIPHSPIIFDNTLESWAKQGILMINSSLTVQENKPGSHSLIWRPFISKLLQNCSKRETGLVYVLFGKDAQSFKPYIDDKHNDVLEVGHPAYYARTNTKLPTQLFKDINRIMLNRYNIPIKWYDEL